MTSVKQTIYNKTRYNVYDIVYEIVSIDIMVSIFDPIYGSLFIRSVDDIKALIYMKTMVTYNDIS